MVKLKVNFDLLPLKGQYFLWNAGECFKSMIIKFSHAVTDR